MSSKKFSWEMGGMNWCTSLTNIPLVVLLLFWGPVVWIPRGSPYERDCYLMGTRFESQTTGPQTQQLTIAKPEGYTGAPGWKKCEVSQVFLALRIIGPSYGGVWLSIGGLWDLQTISFEIPWFLGWWTFKNMEIPSPSARLTRIPIAA